MYICPLCTSSRQGFGSLESLKAHLDLIHCTLTGGAVRRETAVLRELEYRIEKLVDFHTRESGDPIGQGPSEGGKPIGGALLQRYAVDCDLARTENEYLKRKLKDEKKRWNEAMDEEKERYQRLEKEFRNLLHFLESASKQQTDGKKETEHFIDRLLGDLENMERQIRESEDVKRTISRKETQTSHRAVDGDEDGWEPLGTRTRARKLILPTPDHGNVRVDESDSFGRRSRTEVSSVSRGPGRPASSSRSLRSIIAPDSGYDEFPDADKPGVDSSDRLRRDSRALIRERPDQCPASATADRAIFVSYVDQVDNTARDGLMQHNDIHLDPYDLSLVLVFQHLDAVDLLRCALVSRRWCLVARNPLVWRTVRIENRTVGIAVIGAISKWCTRTTKLTLENLRAQKTRSRITQVVDKEKPRDTGVLEDGLDMILRASNGCLIFLKVVDCCPAITDRLLWLAACYCKNLEKVVYVSDQYPATAPSIWALGASCRALNTLVVPPPLTTKADRRVQVDDEALLMIARCFPTTLRVLCVGGRGITAHGLQYVARSCQWLEALELDHCTGLSLRAARSLCKGLKSLQILNFTHCEVSSAALEYFHDHLPQLRSIRVIFSWKEFPTAKHVDAFLADCQARLDNNPNLRKILRIEERL